MGKQGPCYHCGVSSTPLWRNGPPEKPVLCNACGSRWRTKGTLENYTPLHSRAETDVPEDLNVSRVKAVSLMNKEMQFPKRKFNGDLIVGRITPEYNSVSLKSQDDDTRNRSSSGSAISNPETCGQVGYEDASDLTDPAQSIVWETMVPSKKRTCFARPKVSSVEKLTRDLCTIFKEQQKSSQFSLSYQDDLIFENDKPMMSVEIGHGSMLIQCHSSIAREEESETSSLSFDNKLLNEAYSPSPPFSIYSHKVAQTCQNLETEKLKRDKVQHDIKIMGNYNPQLLYVDLNDVVNFDVFTHFLSHVEQQQLLKHLPSLGNARFPHSLESMFASIQFKENINFFQKLLAEGILDSSLAGAPVEECRQLKKLPFFNMSKTKRLEQDDNILKDAKSKGKKEKEKEKGEVTLGNSINTTRTWNNSFKFSGSTTSFKSPDKIIMKENVYKEDKSCDKRFVPKNLLPFPPDGASLMPNTSSQFVDKPYDDEDLLFEVPSNSSFPEAELLIQSTSTLGSKASTSNSSKVSSGFV